MSPRIIGSAVENQHQRRLKANQSKMEISR